MVGWVLTKIVPLPPSIVLDGMEYLSRYFVRRAVLGKIEKRERVDPPLARCLLVPAVRGHRDCDRTMAWRRQELFGAPNEEQVIVWAQGLW